MAGIIEISSKYKSVIADSKELARSVETFAMEADESSELYQPVLDALRSSGLSSLMVPLEYGGRFESVDPLAVCLARETLMKTSSHLDSLFALQGIGSYAISVAGSESQKERWLPLVSKAEALAALALTEPKAGSDLKGIQTIAERKGAEVILRGEKSFISNAGSASFYTTLAKEDDGYSLFLVPADSDGLETTPSPEIIAPHVLGELKFNDVVLPESARLGDPGTAFRNVLATLSVFRISVAGAALGIMEGALEEAVKHCSQREQFGRSLVKHGPVASLLADSWSDLESSRYLTYQTASLAADDPAKSLDRSSLAKLTATEAACRVVDRCVQTMGRWGLIRGSKIEKYYRQARPMRVYEGASEVLRLGIANGLVNEFTDGA
ncbi:MAG: acyl-CoA dehydrogenase [Acidimicrobiaceae bacterium TMED130]|nr:MAG: acyl-CoA dehydrogenase [Acidimicrobiaceae bacterium TMED130]|tara:strand:- start:15884 stop:17029 length:1146 start_codon:yes stop_codon:yes gene_type:complete